MGKAMVAALVSLLVLSALFVLIAFNAAAEGEEVGEFPTRTFFVTRSPPGGPRSDTFKTNITPTEPGDWSARLEFLAGASIIVQVYRKDGGVLVLEGSSKLRSVGDVSTAVPLLGGARYEAWFTPFGKPGTSRLTEIFTVNPPPVASFTFTPDIPVVGETVQFDASGSSDTPPGTIVSYAWDFGDGGTAMGVLASHAYAAAGTYTVTLTVTDDGGARDDEMKSIVVEPNPAPVAVIAFSPAEPLSLDPVTFDGSGSSDPGPARDTIVSYAWDFGDGATGEGVIVTHAYMRPGTYTVTLTVTDSFGAQGSASVDVPVGNRAPTAVLAVSPLSALTFEAIMADGSGSSDPDGEIVSYLIDWGDGTAPATTSVATHEYADGTRTYTITLTVTDDFGATAVDSEAVTIANRPPTAVLVVSPLSGTVGETVFTADGSGSTDRDGSIMSYLIDWGDGMSDPGPTATHVYMAAGPYTVTLTVTDNDGATATDSEAVSVSEVPVDAFPVAVLRVTPTDVQTFEPVTADGSASTDDVGIASYEIDWGDGTAPATTSVATHEYADGTRTYTITLTVTDTIGQTDTATAMVTVRNRPPSAAFSVTTPPPLLSLDPVAFDASASSDRDGSIVAYAWDFGDTTTGTGRTTTHAYAHPGDYVVTLTVTDDDGATGMASMTIHIENRGPVAVLEVTPESAMTFEPITADGTPSSDPDGTIVSYRIEWGDGSPDSSLSRDSHEYADGTRTYTIRLTVTDDFGASASAEASVTILNRPPTADLVVTPATPVLTFEAVTADGTGSSDRDGSIVSYSIDWGDMSAPSALPRDSHEYADDGVYTITLAVTDDDGATASATASVTVNNRAPTAVLSLSAATVLTGDLVTADASGSTDLDGTIASAQLNWGDGTIVVLGPDLMASHAYADDGTYTVTLTVTDDDGATGTDAKVVTVENRPPVAVLSVDPLEGIAGLTSFSADGSRSSDPDGFIASYQIAWGDGAMSVGPTATHIYPTAGSYTVTLTVTDNDGATASTTQIVTVSPPPNLPPTAAFTFSPAAPQEGELVSFDASTSSDPEGPIALYEWDFTTDGTFDATGVMVTYTYAVAGTYTVTLRVTDSGGLTNTTAQQIVVSPVGPPPPGVDWRYYDFFAEPYHEWWDWRMALADERPLGAECFTPEGLAKGVCLWYLGDPTIPDFPTFPYMNWFPNPMGDVGIYAPYRFEASVRNQPAYTIDRPVILPTCEQLKALLAPANVAYDCLATPPPGGSVGVDWYMQYLDTVRATALRDTNGCPDVTSSLGFTMEVRLTLTMDSAAAAKLFGVTDGAMWAPVGAGVPGVSGLLKAGCGTATLLDAQAAGGESGKLEAALKLWFESQGNGPYAIVNSFGAPFLEFAVNATGSFDSVTGTHTLTVTLIGAGHEVLFSRWAYWGATSYRDGVLTGAAPAGWWGMEAPWVEDFHVLGTIGADFSATVTGVQQYHFQALGEAGADGLWGTADDVPKWVWRPILGDRRPPLPGADVSELGAYAGLKYTHATPGSFLYGVDELYDYVPHVWELRAGDTQTFELPTVPVALIDPFGSMFAGDPLFLVTISSPIVLTSAVPGPIVVTSYDPVANILRVVGPISVGAYPTTPLTGKPLESRPIYNFGA